MMLRWGEEETTSVHGGFIPRGGETQGPGCGGGKVTWNSGETYGTRHWIVWGLQFLPGKGPPISQVRCFKRSHLMTINETAPNSPSVTQFLQILNSVHILFPRKVVTQRCLPTTNLSIWMMNKFLMSGTERRLGPRKLQRDPPSEKPPS